MFTSPKRKRLERPAITSKQVLCSPGADRSFAGQSEEASGVILVGDENSYSENRYYDYAKPQHEIKCQDRIVNSRTIFHRSCSMKDSFWPIKKPQSTLKHSRSDDNLLCSPKTRQTPQVSRTSTSDICNTTVDCNFSGDTQVKTNLFSQTPFRKQTKRFIPSPSRPEVNLNFPSTQRKNYVETPGSTRPGSCGLSVFAPSFGDSLPRDCRSAWSFSSEEDYNGAKTKNDVSVGGSGSHPTYSRFMSTTPHSSRGRQRRRRRQGNVTSCTKSGFSSDDSCESSISAGSISSSRSLDSFQRDKKNLKGKENNSPSREIQTMNGDQVCTDDDYATSDDFLSPSEKKVAGIRLEFHLDNDVTPSNVVLKEVPETDVTHVIYHKSPVFQEINNYPKVSNDHKMNHLSLSNSHNNLNLSANFSISPVRKFASYQSSSSVSPLQADSAFINSSNITNTTNSSGVSASSCRTKHRPMPDGGAFVDGLNSCRRPKSTSPIPSPLVCPPTPTRTPIIRERFLNETKLIEFPKKLDDCDAPNSRIRLVKNGSMDSFPFVANRGNNWVDTFPIEEVTAGGGIKSEFEEVGPLGTGQFADVFKYRSKSDGRLYAIKKNKRKFKGQKDRELALVEVSTFKKLQEGPSLCPYLLRFYKAWQEDGYLYCQTELCSGGSCRRLMNAFRNECIGHEASFATSESFGRMVPEDFIWKLCHDVCAGLSYIHKLKMVHHDIKPCNIFFASHSEYGSICKIGDFGIAGDAGKCDDGQEGDQRYMPSFSSSSKKHYDDDMFSLGLTLYELASDHSFELPKDGQIWHAIRSGIRPELPGRSKELVVLIQELINPVPENRPKSVEVVTNEKVTLAGATVCNFFEKYMVDLEKLEKDREEKYLRKQNAARFTPIGNSAEERIRDVCTPTEQIRQGIFLQ